MSSPVPIDISCDANTNIIRIRFSGSITITNADLIEDFSFTSDSPIAVIAVDDNNDEVILFTQRNILDQEIITVSYTANGNLSYPDIPSQSFLDVDSFTDEPVVVIGAIITNVALSDSGETLIVTFNNPVVNRS